MKARKVNHLGILVDDLDEALHGFRDILGLEVSATERYGDELEIVFLPCGETLVELLRPLDEAGWNAVDLRARGPSIQHVAFEVDDLASTLDELRSKGVDTLGDAPRPGAGNTLIAFLEPRHFGGVLVELCQPL